MAKIEKSLNVVDLDILFAKLVFACSHYVDKPEYVYKSIALKDYSCLVVLERLPQTRTNESRKVFDARYSKFRGNIFIW